MRRRWRGLAIASLGAAVAVCAALPGVAGAGPVRHFEKVSPADKGAGDVVSDGASIVASRFGDAIAFNSRTPFGDTVGAGQAGQSVYVARRTDREWVAHSITPTPRPDAQQTFFVATRMQAYSDDLRSAVLWAYDLPGVSGDASLRNNIYVENTETRAVEPVSVSQVDQPSIFDFLNNGIWGVSADARHIAFESSTQFLPNAAPGVPNVYQWDDGVLSLAGILPNGDTPSGGSVAVPAMYRGSMSADGSRMVFRASEGGNEQLYMRIGGTETVQISEPDIDAGPPPGPSNVQLHAMTPDGHTVVFATDAPLVAEDTNGGADLYRWTYSDDPSSNSSLTMITNNGSATGAEVIGSSDDGERVYYWLTSNEVFVWDHGTTTLISGGISPGANVGDRLAAVASGPGMSRVTPDGRHLAFSVKFLVGSDMLGNVTNGFSQMYLYSLDDDSLRCVSCPAGPATMGDVAVLPNVTSGEPKVEMAIRPRFLSDDGEVFFSSREALVPQDANGVQDAYEYDPATGTVSLVSTGEGSYPVAFADASASGDDVFLTTRQRLLPADRDDLVDVYDARIGSTLPAPPEEFEAPACEGDGCQAPPSAGPGEDALGSLALDDTGAGGPVRGVLAVRRRVALRGPAGSLRVRLSVGGRLGWRGRGLVSGTARRDRAGSFGLRLRLGRRARARLRASGSYRTAVRLTFVSAGGDRAHRTTRITFKAVTKKGR